MSDLRLEAVSEEFHRVYLLTAARLGWPIRPGVNAVYGHLAEDAKELDRALARWHLLKMDAAEKRAEDYAAGWAAAREVIEAVEAWWDCPPEDEGPAEDSLRKAVSHFRSIPVPSHVARIRAKEQVVEAARTIFQREILEHGDPGTSTRDWEALEFGLSALDAIEQRIGGKE